MSGLAGVTGGWDYATLPSNVRLGRDCFLEMPESFEGCRSVRDPAVTLGDRVVVYGWTRFNLEPSGCVEVGRDSVLVGAMLMGAERICIGAGVVISYFVTIADSDFHPRDPAQRRLDSRALLPGGDPARRPPIATAPVVIQDDAWIGIGSIVLKGVTVGAGARIDAGAVVAQDVPEGARVAGNPAQVISR